MSATSSRSWCCAIRGAGSRERSRAAACGRPSAITAIGIEPATLGIELPLRGRQRGAASYTENESNTRTALGASAAAGYFQRTVSTSASWGPRQGAREIPAEDRHERPLRGSARDDFRPADIAGCGCAFRAGHSARSVPRFRPMALSERRTEADDFLRGSAARHRLGR